MRTRPSSTRTRPANPRPDAAARYRPVPHRRRHAARLLRAERDCGRKEHRSLGGDELLRPAAAVSAAAQRAESAGSDRAPQTRTDAGGGAKPARRAGRELAKAIPRRLPAALLTESLLLALLGGVAGLVVLLITQRSLLQFVPDGLPRLDEVSIDWTVLLLRCCRLSHRDLRRHLLHGQRTRARDRDSARAAHELSMRSASWHLVQQVTFFAAGLLA
jgi:hypothetical protein